METVEETKESERQGGCEGTAEGRHAEAGRRQRPGYAAMGRDGIVERLERPGMQRSQSKDWRGSWCFSGGSYLRPSMPPLLVHYGRCQPDEIFSTNPACGESLQRIVFRCVNLCARPG